MNKLKPLTNELDSSLGLIEDRISSLVNMEDLLGQVVDGMNTAAHRGLETAYYPEHRRNVSIISDLMRYTVDDLRKEYANVYKICEELYKLTREEKGNE